MGTLNLMFEDFLQKFRDLQSRVTEMDKTILLGFFVTGLPDAYLLQIRNNKLATLEDAIDYDDSM